MNDDILDVLVAHGVPGAIIVRIAKLIADAQQTAERRTRNTERMRVVRTRAHTGAHTETQAKTPAKTNGGLANDGADADLSLLTSSLENEKERKNAAEKRKPHVRTLGTRLSADWKPGRREVDEGHRLGFNDSQIADFAKDMRIWATANANRQIARKADWNETFLGWLRREAKKIAAKKPKSWSGIEGVI